MFETFFFKIFLVLGLPKSSEKQLSFSESSYTEVSLSKQFSMQVKNFQSYSKKTIFLVQFLIFKNSFYSSIRWGGSGGVSRNQCKHKFFLFQRNKLLFEKLFTKIEFFPNPSSKSYFYEKLCVQKKLICILFENKLAWQKLTKTETFFPHLYEHNTLGLPPSRDNQQ